MTYEMIKEIVRSLSNTIEQEAHTEEDSFSAENKIAILQCELLIYIYEKLDSIEGGVFDTLARH